MILNPPPIRPDIIVTWPRNNDYPLWREFIRVSRYRFNEIIVVFMDPNQGPDYSAFVREAMAPDYVKFIDSPKIGPGEDWRDVAVNAGLFHSINASWLWFTEQDFFVMDDNFWVEVYTKSYDFDVIGITQGARLHPACIFIKREALAKTKRRFGIVPGEADHFGQLQKDIEDQEMRRCYFADPKGLDYKHFNGLSHNWTLLARGEEPNYEKEDFYKYLEACLNADVSIEDNWRQIAQNALSMRKL